MFPLIVFYFNLEHIGVWPYSMIDFSNITLLLPRSPCIFHLHSNAGTARFGSTWLMASCYKHTANIIILFTYYQIVDKKYLL